MLWIKPLNKYKLIIKTVFNIFMNSQEADSYADWGFRRNETPKGSAESGSMFNLNRQGKMNSESMESDHTITI